MRTSRTLALVLLAAAAAVPARAGRDAPFPLEGESVVVELRPGNRSAENRGAKAMEETLAFAAGTLSFTELARQGFASAPYTAEEEGKKWEIRATAAGEGGRLTLEADLRQGWLEGVVLVERRGQPELNYSFSVDVEKQREKRRKAKRP